MTGTASKKKSVRCCVPYCESRGFHEVDGKKITFHELPCDSDTRQFFLAFIDHRENGSKVLSDHARLCSLHFESSCFMVCSNGTRKLISGSLPTLLPAAPRKYRAKVNRQYLNIKRNIPEDKKKHNNYVKVKQKHGVARTSKKHTINLSQHAVIENIIMTSEAVEEELEVFSGSEDEFRIKEEVTEPAHSLDDLCRLCSEPCVNNCAQLFSARVPVSLAVMVNFCLPVQVNPEDILPLNICTSCEATVEKCYQFALQCQNAEKHMMQMLREQRLLHLPDAAEATVTPRSPLVAEQLVTTQMLEPSDTQTADNAGTLGLPVPSAVPIFRCKFCYGTFYSEKMCEKHMRVAHKERREELKKEKMLLKEERRKIIEAERERKNREATERKIKEAMERKIKAEERKIEAQNIQETLQPAVERKEKVEKIEQPSRRVTPCQCEICGKVLRWKGALRIHMQRHVQQKNYICHECGLSFIASADLSSHMRSHSRTKVFCDVCNRCYKQKRNLVSHFFEYHLERYRYICNVCNDSFSRKREATEHVTQHIDGTFVKYFLHRCPVCKKRLQTKYEKYTHLQQKHNKMYKMGVQSPFIKCRLCPVWKPSFKSGAGFQKHMDRFHPNEQNLQSTPRPASLMPFIFECELCPSRFKLRTSFSKHMKVKHDTEIDL